VDNNISNSTISTTGIEWKIGKDQNEINDTTLNLYSQNLLTYSTNTPVGKTFYVRYGKKNKDTDLFELVSDALVENSG
jgi:hypothetical protein